MPWQRTAALSATASSTRRRSPSLNGCASSAIGWQHRFVSQRRKDCSNWPEIPRSASRSPGNGWRSIRWTRTRWPRPSKPSPRRGVPARHDARSSSTASGWPRRSASHRRHACKRCSTTSTALRHRLRLSKRGSWVAVQNCGRPKHLLLRDECRVLTLTGPGGVGKSRLAKALVGPLEARFAAVHWIGLEDLTGIEQVVPRTAAALGVSLSGPADPLEQVVAALHGRPQQLLVFDNAEHLGGLAALVERLTQACATVKLLVTSRARLAVSGEWLLPLGGLAAPDIDETEPELIRAFDAVKLFELRAQAAVPAFDAARAARRRALVRRSRYAAGDRVGRGLGSVLPVAESSARSRVDRSARRRGHAPDRQRSVRASFEHSWRFSTRSNNAAWRSCRCSWLPSRAKRRSRSPPAGLPCLATLADKSLLRAARRWPLLAASPRAAMRPPLHDR